jgi:arsenate reductase-like glutaredoxin family protein
VSTTTVNATKDRIDTAKALELLGGIETLLVGKGKKLERLDLKKSRPDDDAILALIMGPTGNLRAPTIKVGKTMIVGFHEEAFGQVFG